jgi:hypothetical protein
MPGKKMMTGRPGRDAIEIDQALKCSLERGDIVEAEIAKFNCRKKGWRQHTRREELRGYYVDEGVDVLQGIALVLEAMH